ncbi:hypothetical protein FE257_005169 [Aspergillus nanangensis]|uniref:Tyrosinase copper-binding domain-containing protein n=1 Tax=Aspergillus nanangensis TaxID=2582783 RepID=A0AAD4CAB7_ASPNN|nr:hypothetical protein FE257_005169 [Aspergillus nanangensis]
MLFSFSASIAVLLAALPATGGSPVSDPWDALANKALVNQIKANHGACNPRNAAVRREWGSLSKSERKHYIDAVRCLASKPPKHDRSFAPGSQNRFDDFVATHINQTWTIHGSGNFLTWHRYFTWAYEQILRKECGYNGYQPYWAWNKYADDPINSPIFDGSPISMSGNGAYVPHNDSEIAPGVFIPAGTGGGCVTSGPFKDWSVNLGPMWPSLKIPGLVAQNGTGLEYNPRCLRRDISPDAAAWTRTELVMDLFNETTILGFQNLLQGMVPTPGYLGVHSGGHFTIGGDPGGDFFTSPGDPVFYLHHAAIDRAFWTWQNMDPSSRTYVVDGGTNLPFPVNTTLDDIVDMGRALAPPETIRDLSNTMGGPFCYVYV